MSLHYKDVKLSTSVPTEWAEVVDRLSKKPIGLNNPPSKAAILRAGLRIYLQHAAPEEWKRLDLGPIPPAVHPPQPVIESTAEEIVDPLGLIELRS